MDKLLISIDKEDEEDGGITYITDRSRTNIEDKGRPGIIIVDLVVKN